MKVKVKSSGKEHHVPIHELTFVLLDAGIIEQVLEPEKKALGKGTAEFFLRLSATGGKPAVIAICRTCNKSDVIYRPNAKSKLEHCKKTDYITKDAWKSTSKWQTSRRGSAAPHDKLRKEKENHHDKPHRSEIRALTADCPEVKPENCKPGITPAEIRSLIAQMRAKALGPDRLAELRSRYQSQHPGSESIDSQLAAISLF